MTDPLALTDGQRQALEELQRISSSNGSLQILRHWSGSGYLWVDISVDCSNLERAENGLLLRPRERLNILVPPQFPFVIPSVRTPHTRWAGTDHVQWCQVLCLYLSPANEWNPSDGMAGFVERLVLWLERAAAGELDAPGQPLHPPVAYATSEAGLVVVRANAPRAEDAVPWLGIALLRLVSDERSDLVGWRKVTEEWPHTPDEARGAAGLGDGTSKMALAFAVMLPRSIAFEYPGTADELINALKQYGVDAEVMLGMLGIVAGINRRLAEPEDDTSDRGEGPPLYLMVGTPSRGIVGSTERQSHLAVWRLPSLAETIARLVPRMHSEVPELARIGREVLELGRDWLTSAETRWARVYEARPELVTARDAGSSASWLLGKRVLVLGAGALGAPIAEACVRGRAARVVVADRGVVHPGILVRQPYEDADIGQPKALALARRLGRIDPQVILEPWCGDVISSMFEDGSPPPPFDLVIDATADRTVRAVIERQRTTQRGSWPALATMLIGHDATRGIATVSKPGASGAGADLLRRLSLTARANATDDLTDVVDDFFPDPPREESFQPEPGCSDFTFIGSAADVTGLAGQLLTGVLHALSTEDNTKGMLALVVRSPAKPDADPARAARWFHWPNDMVLETADRGWQVRVSTRALAEMRAEVRRNSRLRADHVETGGSLLGGFDAAARVVWIDEATGPPPDSRLSEVHFEHGTEGVEVAIAARRKATARVTAFMGMWHSHPNGPASPSPTDEAGMRDLVWPVASAPPRALLLIVGGRGGRWQSWLTKGMEPDWYARVVERSDPQSPSYEERQASSVPAGVTWWAGGSRSPDRPRQAARGSHLFAWLRSLGRDGTR